MSTMGKFETKLPNLDQTIFRTSLVYLKLNKCLLEKDEIMLYNYCAELDLVLSHLCMCVLFNIRVSNP